jgi:hypothetical protein
MGFLKPAVPIFQHPILIFMALELKTARVDQEGPALPVFTHFIFEA